MARAAWPPPRLLARGKTCLAPGWGSSGGWVLGSGLSEFSSVGAGAPVTSQLQSLLAP